MIHICKPLGDSSVEQTEDALMSMGYPITRRECVQSDATRAEQLAPQDKGFERALRHIFNSDADLCYIDYEHHDHGARDTLNTQAQLRIKRLLVSVAKADGKETGVYGEPAIWPLHDEPINAKSIANVSQDGYPDVDAYFCACYLKKRLPDTRSALRFIGGVDAWITTMERHRLPIYLMFQHWVRPDPSEHLPMTQDEAFVMGYIHGDPRVRTVWWWDELWKNADGEFAVNKQREMLEEADRVGEHFMAGFHEGIRAGGI